MLGVPFAIGSLRTAPPDLAPWRVLVVVAVTWQIWTLLTLPVLALADHFPLERPWRVRVVTVHAIASLGVGLTWQPSAALSLRVDYGHALVDAEQTGSRDLQDRGVHFRLVLHPISLFAHR